MSSIVLKTRAYVNFLSSSCKTEILFLLLSVVFLIISIGIFFQTKVSSLEANKVIFKSGSDIYNVKYIYVDVAGAVHNPGVYKLQSSSRVKDALVAANGISAQADRDFVARSVNIARPLVDGEKIFIPEFIPAGNLKKNNDSTSTLGVTNQLININSATPLELDGLSGVGEKTAEKIIKGRPYGQVIELREKKIVGQAVYEKIKDYITTY